MLEARTNHVPSLFGFSLPLASILGPILEALDPGRLSFYVTSSHY